MTPSSKQPRSLLALSSTTEAPYQAPPPIITITEQRQYDQEERLLSKTSLVTVDSVRPFRRQDAPYIRPTKFIPVLDYFSSTVDKNGREVGGDIKPKWKPSDEQQQLSQWRKVTYEVPPHGGGRQKRRDSLSSLMDKNMQEMNKQFKQNISQLSQGLCYNHMERKIQSDLGDKGGESSKVVKEGEGPGTEVITTSKGGVEDANPLIYFKYDFGYEFGIACPRAKSEPPSTLQIASGPASSSRPTSWVEPGTDTRDDAPISLPIIHETTTKK